jgi:hypothetical protein
MAKKSLLTRLFGNSRRAFVAVLLGFLAAIAGVAVFGGPFALGRSAPVFTTAAAVVALWGAVEFFGGSEN